ncbi:DUF397 domain-containing protein [Longispora fulva]|uniref:DUF397 domain-containing protein n=1 Tax=Longispora fulva TaxID=619741 RepID=A0A8J7KMN1_9ACTN|nr:hypothetical protein [Longispora fulva]
MTAAHFIKAARSDGNPDNCVECTFDHVSAGVVGVRDSKDPLGPVLVFPVADWHAFLAAQL